MCQIGTSVATMDQLLEEQHKTSGSDKLSEQQLKDVLGGVLSFVKAKFPGLDFSRIKTVLPDTDALVAKAEQRNAANRTSKDGGGFLANAMGFLEQVTNKDEDDIPQGNPDGSDSADAPTNDAGPRDPIDSLPELIACLAKAGVRPRTLRTLLPTVAGFLKQRAGVDVSSVLGGSSSSSSEAATTASSTPDVTSSAKDDGFVSSFAQ